MVLNPIIVERIVFALIIWVIALTVVLIQTMFHYRKLTKNVTKKDLKSVLSEILNNVNLNQKQLKELDSSLTDARKSMKTHIQKIGFVRFNPFPQTGGDQSFSLALLDEKDSGFVLSSLHSRDTTRFYAKTVKNSKGDGYDLSKEENQAVSQAK